MRIKIILIGVLWAGLVLSCGPGQQTPVSVSPGVDPAAPPTVQETPLPPITPEETTREGQPPRQPPSPARAPTPLATPQNVSPLPTRLEGVVTSVLGDVSLHRDDRDLSRELDIGFVLRDFDLVSTGGNGTLTANFRGPGLPGATLTVRPNTKVYVEQSLLASGGSRTTFQMLTGNLALNVRRLAGSQVGVNVQSTALGVRGTQFEVIIAPQLEVLVTCSEGQVSVVQGDQRSSAIPGRAVTSKPEEGLAEYSVQVQNIKRFQERWLSLLLEEFEGLAIPLMKTVYRRWDRNLTRFRSERARLMAQGTILAKWRSALDSGTPLGTVELLRDKRSVAPILLNLKKALYFLERDWAWLATVQKNFPATALGEDVGGITAQQFFQQYSGLQRELGIQFSEVRGAFRLLAAVDPDSPLGDFFAE